MSDGNLRQGPWSPSNAAGGGGVDGGGSGAHVPDMEVRLARLEGEFSAFKTMLAAVIAIMLGGFAFLGAQLSRMDSRITGLEADVQALPGKINGDLLNLTRTLADAINAAKQTPPQVLLLPAPGTQPPSRP